MTLLFIDGFDNADKLMKPEWDSGNGWSTFAGRLGETNGSAMPNYNSIKFLTLPTPATKIVAGWAIRTNASGGSPFGGNQFAMPFATMPVGFTSGTTPRNNLYISSTGKLQIRQGGTVMATGTATIQANSWTHLQAIVTNHASAGIFKVYVNGVLDIDFAGPTSTVTGDIYGLAYGSDGQSLAYDDMWVCDGIDATATQGRAFNDVLGDLRIATLLPSGAGAGAQWTPNTAVENSTTVDENPPNQTDYNSAATAGLRDTYATTDLPANASSVLALRAGAYAAKTDAGVASVKPGIRDPAGSFIAPSTVALNVTWGPAWASVVTRKADASLWSVADVNAAQVGVESA